MEEYLKNSLFEGIISKREVQILSDNQLIDKSNTVLISIVDPDVEYLDSEVTKNFKGYIGLKFWDIEEQIGNYSPISTLQAEEIRDFIVKNQDKKFLIHCMAGQSRSAGVACAVECIVNFDGDVYNYQTGSSDVKAHPRYYPNLTVFDKICKG